MAEIDRRGAVEATRHSQIAHPPEIQKNLIQKTDI